MDTGKLLERRMLPQQVGADYVQRQSQARQDNKAGFFIETLSLMVATIPIVVPIIVRLGCDKLWFGILMIILVEMALITPPVGLNLYVVQAARKSGRFSDVMIGVIPYAFAMLIMVGLLILFPAIALFLPSNL